MKTAEEWIASSPLVEAGAPFICATEEVIKQIQLDAMKFGLAEAYVIVQDLPIDFERCKKLLLVDQAWLEAHEQAMNAIAEARDSETPL